MGEFRKEGYPTRSFRCQRTIACMEFLLLRSVLQMLCCMHYIVSSFIQGSSPHTLDIDTTFP